jgi:hypothetical protein
MKDGDLPSEIWDSTWFLPPSRSSENLCDRSDADIRRSNIPTNILIITWHQREKIMKTNKNLMGKNWLKFWSGSILDKHPFLHGCGLRAYLVTVHSPDVHHTQAKLRLGISEVCCIHRSNRGICWGPCGNGQAHRSVINSVTHFQNPSWGWNDGKSSKGRIWPMRNSSSLIMIFYLGGEVGQHSFRTLGISWVFQNCDLDDNLHNYGHANSNRRSAFPESPCMTGIISQNSTEHSSWSSVTII